MGKLSDDGWYGSTWDDWESMPLRTSDQELSPSKDPGLRQKKRLQGLLLEKDRPPLRSEKDCFADRHVKGCPCCS